MKEYFRKPYMTQGIGRHSDYMKAIPQRAIDVQGTIAPNIEFKKPYDFHPNTAQMLHYYANNLHYFGGDPVPPLNDPSLLPHSPVVVPEVHEETYVEGRGDSYCSLLLHADQNGNAFIDSSLSRKTITTTGDAIQDFATYKFGLASGKFNNGYLTTPADASFNMGTGDYTIDFQIKTTQNATAIPIYQGNDGGTPSTVAILFQFAGNLLAWSYDFKLYPSHHAIVTTSTINDGLWHHIATVRTGDNFMLFADGIQEGGTQTSVGYENVASANVITVGKQGSSANQFIGWIDELQISKGIARWTSNFTPPTKAY
jgi:hypothetical protein